MKCQLHQITTDHPTPTRASTRSTSRCFGALGRLGEEVAERQWRDAIGVLKVQRRDLDWEYMEKWAGSLGVSDLLKRARMEAFAPARSS